MLSKRFSRTLHGGVGSFIAVLYAAGCATPALTPTATPTGSAITSTQTYELAVVPTTESSAAPTAEPTDSTTYEEPVYLDNRSDPHALIESYFNALGTRSYIQAYSYWEPGSEVADFDTFQQGYQDTASISWMIGTGRGGVGAGQTYYNIPVVIQTALTDGTAQAYSGCFRLHIGMPSAQGTPPFQPLAIQKADVQKVDSGSDSGDLLAHACDIQNTEVGAFDIVPQSADNANDISGNRYLDDRSDPVQVIRSLFNAINRHEYVRAYSYWEDNSDLPSFEDYQQGYMDTQTVEVTFGTVTPNPGAGQRFYTVPVTIVASRTDSSVQTYIACYILHQTFPGFQTVPPFEGLGIMQANAKLVVNGMDTTQEMMNYCYQGG